MQKEVWDSAARRVLGTDPVWVLTGIARGRVKAHRRPGGGRRLCLGDLLGFSRVHRIATPSELQSDSRQVLVVDGEPAVVELIAGAAGAAVKENGERIITQRKQARGQPHVKTPDPKSQRGCSALR